MFTSVDNQNGKKQRILVVGNGMVGHKFIDNLLNSDDHHKFELVTFSEEPRLAYDRVKLSYYFAGSSVQDLMLTSEVEYQQRGVRYHLDDKVVAIDPLNNHVTTASGHIEVYDKLVLATGSYPFVPPLPGKDQPHCLVYR